LYNNLIRDIIVASGVVTTLAGSGSSGNADGVGTSATFFWPHNTALDGSGFMYVTDYSINRIRSINIASRTVSTLAGGGSVSGTAFGRADGIGSAATFGNPFGAAVSNGIVYVVEKNTHLVRAINISTRVVMTIAGGGSSASAAASSAATGVPAQTTLRFTATVRWPSSAIALHAPAS
jgi:hypothetical protein